MLITGTKTDLDAILKAQDKSANLPLPPSKYIDKKRVNICPRCECPIMPPWLCAECGWVPGDEARRACITSLCEAVMIDGVMVAQVSERAECGAGVCAWAHPVAAREDDLGEIELGPEPPRKP